MGILTKTLIMMRVLIFWLFTIRQTLARHFTWSILLDLHTNLERGANSVPAQQMRTIGAQRRQSAHSWPCGQWGGSQNHRGVREQAPHLSDLESCLNYLTNSVALGVTQSLWVSGCHCCLLLNNNIGKQGLEVLSVSNIWKYWEIIFRS